MCIKSVYIPFLYIPFLLAACASAPSRYFSVGAPPASAADTSPAAAPRCLVNLDSASVPAIVNRPQLVVSTAPGQVSIREQARWAAPLREAIPDALRDAVERETHGAIHVRRGGRLSEGLRVEVEVERFELGDKSVSASFEVYTSDATKLRDTRSIHAEVAPAAGADRDAAIAAAAQQAVDEAGRQLAAFLSTQCP